MNAGKSYIFWRSAFLVPGEKLFLEGKIIYTPAPSLSLSLSLPNSEILPQQAGLPLQRLIKVFQFLQLHVLEDLQT